MKRLLAFAPLALLALIAIVAVVMLTRGEGKQETFTGGDMGRPAPTYALTRLGGGALVTSDAVKGRVHLVNIFASWCGPCRAEHPLLMDLKSRGVEIVGVAYKDEPADTQAFLDEVGNPFADVALDPEGRFGLELGMAGVPETFVVDAEGRIRAVHRGPLTEEIVASEILPALNAR